MNDLHHEQATNEHTAPCNDPMTAFPDTMQKLDDNPVAPITKCAGIRPFGDKRAVAAMAGFSKRWVDQQMKRGMPFLKLGPRRVRFDLAEVREWLIDKYHVQQRSPASTPQKNGDDD